MSDVKWDDTKIAFTHMTHAGIGHLELIDGYWVADDGRRFTLETENGDLALVEIKQ